LGKRLGIGLAKGLVVGAAIGCAVLFGAHWSTPSGGLLAYLLALGVGGTTGIFAGRAPWKEGAWIEASIKGVFGLIAAALLYWLGASYGAARIPWPGQEHTVAWTSLPPLFLGAIGAIYGALVELDHDGDDEKKSSKKAAAKTRVVVDDDTEHADAPAVTRAARKK
jgi:hypothetical protein